ncbi:hypothetical protein [Afifella marina]|uniref:Sulfotransferase family protein n=1 Tax=Afifella marina DSM 2698 TaxID=1120955 RepID=A0A1G5NCC1_AFIMA|nr:hypothetical protein [Afifella marina]MBK1623183.1 hypothetical protein [Afifella marina DSM 2698]MBK1626177.1 hypothetical protein [Afifella marina]MBK5917055.1 hypothetical protein [Afifella marina]RAI22047.1 hypothetical protein CH311_04875 [Afifella marina DSM 2698]SCZ34568.1 hypothetical protein SAMN03080610_01716 [Afifella marina DSM 2698]
MRKLQDLKNALPLSRSDVKNRQKKTIDKIFFLHIPKTAGSAFNLAFQQAVPAGRHFEHMESQRELFYSIISDGKPFYASGHFPFSRVRELVMRPDVFTITIFREPLKQLLSHLKWVKAYGRPDGEARRHLIPENIAELSLALWETDLNDVARLEPILTSPTAISLFDNTQTRYMTRSVAGRISEEQGRFSMGHLRHFDFFFVLDDMAAAHKKLTEKIPGLGSIPRTNEAMLSETIDLQDGKLRDFYETFVRFDRQLYDNARRRSRRRFLDLAEDETQNA